MYLTLQDAKTASTASGKSLTKRYSIIAAVIVSLLPWYATTSRAQAPAGTTNPTTVGTDPLGSYKTGVDQINLGDLGLHIDIPLYKHRNQRGGNQGVSVDLIYDTSYYDFALAPSAGSNQPLVMSNSGWRISATNLPGGTVLAQSAGEQNCQRGQTNCTPLYDVLYGFQDQSGYTHQFAAFVGLTTHYPTSASEYSTDGSGYLLTAINSGTGSNLNEVTTPSGTRFIAALGTGTTTNTETDRNGNTTSNPYYVDINSYLGLYSSLGTEYSPQTYTDASNISVQISGGGYSPAYPAIPTARNPVYISYKDTTGTTQTITITYKIHSILPVPFQLSNTNQQYNPNLRYYTGLVDTITYPDGTSYHFTYQTSSFLPGVPDGQLASMELPTGGTISYQNTWTPQTCNSLVYGNGVNAPILTQAVRSNQDGATSYSRTINSTAPNGVGTCPVPTTETTSVTHPDQSKEVVQLVGVPEILQTVPADPGNVEYVYHNMETEHTWYGSTNNLLQSKMTCYNGASGNCATSAVSLPITQAAITTTLSSGQTSQVIRKLNSLGLLTELDEYDFGASSATRRTVTQYASLGNNIADRPSSVMIQDSGGNTIAATTYGYDEYSLANASGAPLVSISGARGNQTSVHNWLNTTNTTIDTHTQYDAAGQAVKTQDGRTNWTQYAYDSATDTCVVTITPTTPLSGVSLATTATCDPNSGVVTAQTDQNGVKTAYYYNLMLQPTGSNTTTSTGTTVASMTRSYSGSSLPETITTTLTATPSPNEVSSVTLDGLGRTISQIAPSGANTATIYNSMGYVASVSNPYVTTGDLTYGLTSYKYDGLGRPLSLTHSFDGSSQQWTYSGNEVTYSDETGRVWERWSDAFGRLIKVLEPDGSTTIGKTPTLETDYQYDGLNDLIRVDQWGGPSGSSGDRIRIIQYDSLSRVLKACNPETIPSGDTCSTSGPWGASYSYDNNGNVLTKTDGRGVTINYLNYDTVNRVGEKTYTVPSPAPPDYATTPSVTYSYDQTTFNGLAIANGTGRRTGMTDGAGQSAWSYDPMGRQAEIMRTTGGVTKSSVSTYDEAGNLTNILYYSGRNVTFTNDAAGRAVAAIDPNLGVNFVTSVSYAPPGEVAGMLSGKSNSFAGVTTTNQYDGRMRLHSTSTASPSATLQSYTYSYDAVNDIQEITNNVTSARSQSFTYDNMNRLLSGQAGSLWGNTYLYDSFGNLYQFNQISGTATGQSMQVTPTANNQLSASGLVYDSAGNMYQDTLGNIYHYDAESRVASVGSYTYEYDGDGNRVIKMGSSSKTFWYGVGGQVVNEFDTSGNNPESNIYLAGALRARIDTNGNTNYLFGDQIGSARIVTSASGTVEDNADYYPFGTPANYSTFTSSNLYKFAGRETDTESGLDYLAARYYGSFLGRFTTPDPGWALQLALTNPQSLNQYSYVLNNPLINTDPSGEECVWDDGTFDAKDDPDTGSVSSCQGAGGTWIELGMNGRADEDPANPETENLKGIVANLQSGQFNTVTAQGSDGQKYVTTYNQPQNGQTQVDFTIVNGQMNQYTYAQQNPATAQQGPTTTDTGFAETNYRFKLTQLQQRPDPNTLNGRIQALSNYVNQNTDNTYCYLYNSTSLMNLIPAKITSQTPYKVTDMMQPSMQAAGLLGVAPNCQGVDF